MTDTTPHTPVRRRRKAAGGPAGELVVGEIVSIADLAAERRAVTDVAGAIAGAVVAEFAATIRTVRDAQRQILAGVAQCRQADAASAGADAAC